MASVEDAPTVRSPIVVDKLPLLVRGDVVGDFVVEALIAQGGMASVFEVRHRALGSVYALKVIDPSLLSEKPRAYRDMIRARTRREGRIQSQLEHPHIVRVHHLLEVRGTPALVMDLVDGPSLHVLIDERDRLDWHDVHDIGVGLLHALRAAHASGVVHRDVKPANVLMARVGGRWAPKLADFGLAKAPAPINLDLELTLTGQTMGTIGYMPPPQRADAKHVGPRVDVFAAGAVLYELITGRPLAARWGEADADAVAHALEGLDRHVDVPSGMRDAVEACLAGPADLDVDDVLRRWGGAVPGAPAVASDPPRWQPDWRLWVGIGLASAAASAWLLL